MSMAGDSAALGRAAKLWLEKLKAGKIALPKRKNDMTALPPPLEGDTLLLDQSSHTCSSSSYVNTQVNEIEPQQRQKQSKIDYYKSFNQDVVNNELDIYKPDTSVPHYVGKVIHKQLLTPLILRIRINVYPTPFKSWPPPPPPSVEEDYDVKDLQQNLEDRFSSSRNSVKPFHFVPGEYLWLCIDNYNKSGLSLIRTFSISNLPEDGYIELHVRLVRYGKMTGYLFNSLRVNDYLHLRGHQGRCVYNQQKYAQYNLLLIGIGSGFAPMMGILRQAIKLQHHKDIYDDSNNLVKPAKNIYIYFSSLSINGVYFVSETTQFIKHVANVDYYPFIVTHPAKQSNPPTISGVEINIGNPATHFLKSIFEPKYAKKKNAGFVVFMCGTFKHPPPSTPQFFFFLLLIGLYIYLLL
jgi:hypothetical protein